MTDDDLVLVKLRDDHPTPNYRGACGFYITKGEQKKCPQDVYELSNGILQKVETESDDLPGPHMIPQPPDIVPIGERKTRGSKNKKQ